MRFYSLFFFVCVFFAFNSCNYKDQQNNLANIAKHIDSFDDTRKYKAFDSIAKYYLDENPKKSIEFSKKSLKVAESLNDKRKIGKSYFLIGFAYDKKMRSFISKSIRLNRV